MREGEKGRESVTGLSSSSAGRLESNSPSVLTRHAGHPHKCSRYQSSRGEGELATTHTPRGWTGTPLRGHVASVHVGAPAQHAQHAAAQDHQGGGDGEDLCGAKCQDPCMAAANSSGCGERWVQARGRLCQRVQHAGARRQGSRGTVLPANCCAGQCSEGAVLPANCSAHRPATEQRESAQRSTAGPHAPMQMEVFGKGEDL